MCYQNMRNQRGVGACRCLGEVKEIMAELVVRRHMVNNEWSQDEIKLRNHVDPDVGDATSYNS
jgi:hypothetical protein